MNKADQAKLYRELMGKEAADRQITLPKPCPECNAKPGAVHSWQCKFRGRVASR